MRLIFALFLWFLALRNARILLWFLVDSDAFGQSGGVLVSIARKQRIRRFNSEKFSIRLCSATRWSLTELPRRLALPAQSFLEGSSWLIVGSLLWRYRGCRRLCCNWLRNLALSRNSLLLLLFRRFSFLRTTTNALSLARGFQWTCGQGLDLVNRLAVLILCL